MLTSTIVETLNEFLEIEKFHDYAPNGLQVQGKPETNKIVFGVSASLELIDKAIALGAQTIIVHHGYFWKNESPCVVGVKQKRLTKLLTNQINLLAYHLPLDANPVLGNNVLFGKKLGLKKAAPLKSEPYVLKASFRKPITAGELKSLLKNILGREPFTVCSNPKQQVKTVAWCTGAAQDFLQAASLEGADAYISGEISERTVLESRELGVTYFSVGHHASETLGISELAVWLKHKFPKLDITFLDIPNPV